MHSVSRAKRALCWSLVGLNVALVVSLSTLSAHVVRVNTDPFHGVPACTHEIADAGGICHGEPK